MLVSCGGSREKKVEAEDAAEKTAVVGNDKDEHGCITSAGYTWCEVQRDCIRLWEKGIRMTSVADARGRYSWYSVQTLHKWSCSSRKKVFQMKFWIVVVFLPVDMLGM